MQASPETTTVGLDMMVDNITWSASGRLLAARTYGTSMQAFLAGHLGPNPRLGIPSRVIGIDPETLAAETLLDPRTGWASCRRPTLLVLILSFS